MASSEVEALAEAKTELLGKTWVIDAVLDETYSEDKPGNTKRRRFNIFHMPNGKGSCWSHKELYIDMVSFNYYWHYGGPSLEPIPAPFKDFLESKIEQIKTAMNLELIVIVEVDEIQEHATIYAYKNTTGNNADTYKVKIYKTGPDTYDYLIIEKTTVP